MSEIARLKALAAHPNGVQITLYPDRSIIDLGYGGQRKRFRAEILSDAIEDAEDEVMRVGRAGTVEEAVRNIVFQDALEAAG